MLLPVPGLYPVIHARRLDLVLMTPDFMRAVLAADWPAADRLLGVRLPAEWQEEDWRWLVPRVGKAEIDPAALVWFPRAQVLRAAHPDQGPAVVGEAGFHGPPDGGGRAEFGYTVVAEYRRRGSPRKPCGRSWLGRLASGASPDSEPAWAQRTPRPSG